MERDPQKLAQSAVLGLQFWVGAKHFREGRMEVGAKDEEEIREQLIELMAAGKSNYSDVMRRAEMEKN